MLISGGNEESKAAFLKAIGMESEYDRVPWPLPNMKDSAERDFWGYRASYSFLLEAWCDHVTVDNEPATLLVFFLNRGHFIDGGFAVAVVYRGTVAHHPRYFTWGACEHKFSHRTTGNCQHRYTCERCGQHYDIDSSG